MPLMDCKMQITENQKIMNPKIKTTGWRFAMFLAVSLFIACEHEFEQKLPLAINQHKLTLDASAGSTPVLVYATESWTAFFAEGISWAAIRRHTGRGNGEFVLEYGDNPGIARMTEIIIRSNGLEKNIVVTQTGVVSEPEILLTEPTKELNAAGGEIALPFETNLTGALDRIAAKTVCLDVDGGELPDAEPWIADIRIAADAVTFTAAANATGAVRKLRLTLEVDDAVNGTLYTTSTNLTQIAGE